MPNSIFLFEFPKIYSCISPATRILVDAETNTHQEFQFISWFKYESFDEYFEMISKLIEGGYFPSFSFFTKVLYLAEQFNKKNEYLDLAIEMFGKSASFSSADSNFSKFIDPVLNELNEEQLIRIVLRINNNGQISGRGRASSDNKKVKEVLNKINPEFDFSPYTKFK